MFRCSVAVCLAPPSGKNMYCRRVCRYKRNLLNHQMSHSLHAQQWCINLQRVDPSTFPRINRHRGGDVPSGRSAASFLPRDNSSLGSSRATHSTRHVARVTF